MINKLGYNNYKQKETEETAQKSKLKSLKRKALTKSKC